jgi:hypothetical protein
MPDEDMRWPTTSPLEQHHEFVVVGDELLNLPARRQGVSSGLDSSAEVLVIEPTRFAG